MKLYELSAQYKQLQNMDGIEPEAIADTLESIEGEIQEKAQAIVAVRLGMDADIEAIDAEIDRLTQRKKRIQSQEQSIRDYLKHNMQAIGITNIKCPLFSITLAKGREVVQIDDELELPPEFVSINTSVKPDRKKIKEALKNGDTVPGARIVRNDETLIIK